MADSAGGGDGSVAVVTGAGSGIGAAAAVRLGGSRGNVVLVGRRAEALAETAELVRGAGGEALPLPLDLSEPDAPERILAAVEAEFGRLDTLVNNAAIIRTAPLEESTLADFDDHVAVNLRAPFLLARMALPLLAASERASIVNVTSSSASLVRPDQGIYAMTKAGLEYLTRSWAAELAPRRIRVNAIAPGPVDTPIHLTWAESQEEALAWLKPQIPLGRMGQADEVGAWIEFLCGPDSSWVTGAVIPVDGGQALDFR